MSYLMPCILFEEPFIPHIFSLLSWETSAGIIWGWQKKHIRLLLFCLGISKPFSLRKGLILPYMLGLDFFSCLHRHVFIVFLVFTFSTKNKNKNWGRRCKKKFSFLLIAFQMLYVFLPDISVHCALIEYAYIWFRVYAWYLLNFPVNLNTR
jgi:hypothetical protein